MKIGVDISQLAYANTGVANYLKNLVESLIDTDKENEYILFYSSLRRNFQSASSQTIFQPKADHHLDDNFQSMPKNVKVKTFKFPPTLLDILWNKLHIVPIEWFIGDVDIFITSDWTEPPVKHAKKATILYDLIVYKYPQESTQKIVETQKRKLKWVQKETTVVLCISESTKKDAMEILGIDEKRLHVVYPGITLLTS